MKKTVLTVTAICLATLLLCGAACFGTVNYLQRQNASQTSAASAAVRLPDAGESGYTAALLAGKTAASSGALSATEIYELACKQVVGISTTFTGYNMFGQLSSNAVSGTGFILSADGYILTNNHVVEDALSSGSTVTVKLYDGSEYDAEIVGVEGTDNDIAVLKINATGLTPVTLGNSDEMQVGESIYVVGNPLGELTYTMTAGIISALDREIAADRNTTVNMFQLDAAVNSGNSGGPVYNSRGQVIGVVTAKYNSTGVEGLGFAIPVNDARAIAEEIVEHGYVTGKPYLGIVVTNMTESEAQRYNTVAGVYVYSVSEGSCAEKAGLQQGDVIVELGGKAVATTSDLATVKKDYKAGDSCELKFYRSGKYQTVTVVFDEEPAQTADTGSASENPREGAGQMPGFGGGQQPGSGDRQQPGDGEQGEDDKSGFGSFGDSFEDWMNDFFGRFYDYFGGGSSSEDDSDAGSDKGSDSGSSGGFHHFGT